VQSTPLVDMCGQLVGVLSTHYPRPYRPPAEDLALMKRFGELIGQAFEACLGADGKEPVEFLRAGLRQSPRSQAIGCLPAMNPR
jgi:GAF domain-containing protein